MGYSTALNMVPGRSARFLLALLPFVLMTLIYVVSSAERRASNPNDKLLPPIAEIATTIHRLAFEADRRS